MYFLRHVADTESLELLRRFTVVFLVFLTMPLLPVAVADKPKYADLYTRYDKCEWKEITAAEEKAKVFRLIADSCESSYKQITCWQATYLLNDFFFDNALTNHQLDRDFLRYNRRKAEFSVDFKDGKLNWKYQCEPNKLPTRQIVLNHPNKPNQNNLIPDDDLTYEDLTYQSINLSHIKYVRQTFTPFTGQRETIPGYDINHQIVVDAHSADRIHSSPFSQQIFDPRYFFGSGLSAHRPWAVYWGLCETIAPLLEGISGDEKKNLFNERFHLYQAEYDDEILYKTVDSGGSSTPFEERIYSSAVGFNIVNWNQYLIENIVTISLAWQYTEEDGIFIPNVYSSFHRQGGFLSEFILQNSKLNTSLPKDIFEVSALGLKDGDIIVNYQEKKNYIFRNGKMEFLCNFGETPAAETIQIKTGYSPRQKVFIFGGILLILTGLGLTLLPRKSAK